VREPVQTLHPRGEHVRVAHLEAVRADDDDRAAREPGPAVAVEELPAAAL